MLKIKDLKEQIKNLDDNLVLQWIHITDPQGALRQCYKPNHVKIQYDSFSCDLTFERTENE